MHTDINYTTAIYKLMVEFRKRFNATPMVLRMPPKCLEEMVSQLGLSIKDFRPLSEEDWRQALKAMALSYKNCDVTQFIEGTKVLEFEVRGFYAGMLVGVSDQYTDIAVSMRISVEMDEPSRHVLYLNEVAV